MMYKNLVNMNMPVISQTKSMHKTIKNDFDFS